MAQALPYVLMAASTHQSVSAERKATSINQQQLSEESAFQKERTALELERQKGEATQRKGTITATMNKSGRPIGEGTSLNLLAQQARNDELDALIIKYGGDITQRKIQTEQYKERVGSRNRQTSTILGGLTSAASTYFKD